MVIDFGGYEVSLRVDKNIRENKMKDIKIIELTEEDFHGAYEVFKVTVPYAFALSEDDLSIEVIEAEIENKKKVLEAALSKEKTGIIVLVAKINDEVIGTIAFGPCSEAIRQCTNDEFSNVGELGSLFKMCIRDR